ncbi:MAG: zinc ABC transporter substrate-binding protein [Lachnospiraceae bacterium]|nr:zinc ABC transporter substrate-binding protein [Lachnospiraceae bacterium]
MKKIIALFLISVMMVVSCTGCGQGIIGNSSDKITIVCTMFSQYDWTKQVVGNNENIEIILLGDTGVDMHSFQPSADDIITISDCDVFIYGGGISDSWVEDILAEATNEEMIVINMMETLGDNLKEEEFVEGMQDSEEHEHDHEAEETEHDNDFAQYDEHVWLSINNAMVICDRICQVMSQIDADNKDIYKENLDNYMMELENLDSLYAQMASSSQYNTVLFGDRFPYIYMMRDYNIEYYAAFSGCSADAEASFETVTFLAKKIDELNIPVILIEKGSNRDLAQTIIDSTIAKNQTILEMNSMQSMTKEQLDAGESYISIMQDNLEILKQALGCQ